MLEAQLENITDSNIVGAAESMPQIRMFSDGTGCGARHDQLLATFISQ